MAKKPTYDDLTQQVADLTKQVADLKQLPDYPQIVRGSPIPTFVIDSNHIITHCNKAFENLTGIAAHDLIGTRKQWLAFYPTQRPVMADLIVDNASEEELTRYYGRNYWKSSVTEGGYEAEGFFPDLGEKGRWIFFTAAPLKDEKGNITGAIETLQDISERKWAQEALSESRRHIRTLLDFAPYPIVVFTLDGRVEYLNPAFTETFGWNLAELEGKLIPYTPPDLEQETGDMVKKLSDEKVILRYQTRRLTKDGRLLDVVMRGTIFTDVQGQPAGELVIIRDITREKRIALNNEAMLRISMALPEYPDLGELLDYISKEVKRLLNSEGGVVILLDEERQELFFPGAAYDDSATQKRVREIRFQMDELVAGQVIQSGKPMIVSDISGDAALHSERDKKLGYKTKNLLLVPLRSSDRIIGVLTAINKKQGTFEQTDVELLSMIATTVALSIENARFSEELMKAYRELTSLNRAKDRVFHHLSHELKTPISVLDSSLKLMTKNLTTLPDKNWKRTMTRAERNLERIMEIQYQVDDIVQDKQYQTYDRLSSILDQCADLLEALIAEQVGEGPVIGHVRNRIEEIFNPKEMLAQKIALDAFVNEILEDLNPQFAHRQVDIITRFEPTPLIYMPLNALQKVVVGLIKNAIENTPDEGKIEVVIQRKDSGTQLIVQDYGVGITEDNQKRIFDGFFSTQDTMDYSTKKPFDFNAGGKGADLLRMKKFSERYNFNIEMTSSRCQFIPQQDDICPGRINECEFCTKAEDCYRSGGTTFSLYFPPAP
ncbi:MAG: PAS domain S-box protein [Desulfobacterales bacterium]|jgi:PAS domain S-box-containing protein